ncbi:MAG: DNA polymerase III subunit gamma/tau [Hyphomicrobium sp.]|nr:DNA polymerase III subunit gamma/tau [Hyphomicrobium sp.]
MAKKKSDMTGSAGGAGDGPAKPYVVLARKYRPQSFDDLIGQEAMVKTLRNAFASGRIAQGYMLTGVRGIGKTTTARILARALNYETDTVDAPTVDMPLLGRHCAEIIESRHADVIEMDAASHTGVDNMREIIENARYKPILARMKVFIIDEVHMLSKGAFNALLKTLEEPPEHVKFIFATTEIRKVPVTVLSRCQRFDLRRVDVPLLSQHLVKIAALEGVDAEADAVTLIARAAGGSVRDGLSLLDQAIAMSDGPVTSGQVRDMMGFSDRGRVFDLLEALVGGKPQEALKLYAGLYRDGGEPTQLLADLADCVHIATRVKVMGAGASGEGLSAEERRRAQSLAGEVSLALLARLWQMLLKGLDEAGKAPDGYAAAEMVLIRIAYMADLPPPEEIIKAIGRSDRRNGGAGAQEKRPESHAGDRGVRATSEALQAERGPSPGSVSGSQARPFDDAPPLEVYEELAAAGYGEGPDLFQDASGQDASGIEGLGDEDDAPTSGAPDTRVLNNFEDVVRLIGERRDVRLKVHIEEHVSLVRFDASAPSIELYLLSGAPPEIANELREKLNKWTGRRWMVALSKAAGQPPIAETRRQREAEEIARLKQHPAVSAVLQAFPDAKIAVRQLGKDGADPQRDDETGTG